MIYIKLWVRFWFKKLIISFKVIEKIKIISLCSQIEVLLKENYFEKSFLINAFLISQSNSFSLRSLIDSDFIVYMLIHDKLVNKIYQKLEIQSILLAKKKLIWDYDEKLVRKIITYKILLNLTIESSKKLTMSMLIADIEHHEAILSKFWMNKNEILLNMKHDTIIFFDQLNISISIFLISTNIKHSSWSRSTLISSAARSVVKFELLNSTQIEFQCWVELREINSTQSSWVRLSTQLSQLDELTRTWLQIYFLSNFLSNSLSKWSNSLSNFLSNFLSCFLSYFLSYSHHISHYVSHYIFYHILYYTFYHISHHIFIIFPTIFSIIFLINLSIKFSIKLIAKLIAKKKLKKKRKSILFLVHSILYLVTKIEFKQLNSILNWA